MRLGSLAFIHCEQSLVIFDHVMIVWRWHKEVSPDCPYFILDIALFPAGFRITVPDLKAVLSTELFKHLGFDNFVMYPMADSGSIVEDQDRRNSSDVGKDILKSLTDALCVFTTEELSIGVIAKRKRNDQIFPADATVVLIEIRLSEIHLSITRIPDQFLRSFVLDILTDLFQIPLYCLVAACITLFLNQPVVDPLCCMMLFAPVFSVLLKPLPDRRFKRIKNG